MGNFTSCICVKLREATLIDVHGNQRQVKVPITAAEMMLLEEPGHLISPVADDLRSNFRLSALRADDELINGKLYMLIPVGRFNSFVTESKLEMLRSVCKRKTVKQLKRRRSSKVLPRNEVGEGEGSLDETVESGFTGQRMGSSSPMWKPVLELIYE